MSLAQGNNTPTRPRIEPGSPDPESDALTTRPVRPLEKMNEATFFLFKSEKKRDEGHLKQMRKGLRNNQLFFSLRYNIIEKIGSHCGGSWER